VASVESCLGAAPDRCFDRFNLSDIFEYVSPAASERLFDDITRCARPGARIAYWNMMVARACPPRLVPRLQPQPALGDRLQRQALAFFYGALHVDQRGRLP
jgi:S-adenosylmethionine-diacylglycerol 3-amino-3-carboxypropyl transferase